MALVILGAFPPQFSRFLDCKEGECSVLLKEMRINYGCINTSSSPVPHWWAKSPVGTWHVPHRPSPPGVGVPQVVPGSAGKSAGNWEGVGRAGLALGEVGHHGEEVRYGMGHGMGYGMG